MSVERLFEFLHPREGSLVTPIMSKLGYEEVYSPYYAFQALLHRLFRGVLVSQLDLLDIMSCLEARLVQVGAGNSEQARKEFRKLHPSYIQSLFERSHEHLGRVLQIPAKRRSKWIESKSYEEFCRYLDAINDRAFRDKDRVFQSVLARERERRRKSCLENDLCPTDSSDEEKEPPRGVKVSAAFADPRSSEYRDPWTSNNHGSYFYDNDNDDVEETSPEAEEAFALKKEDFPSLEPRPPVHVESHPVGVRQQLPSSSNKNPPRSIETNEEEIRKLQRAQQQRHLLATQQQSVNASKKTSPSKSEKHKQQLPKH